MKHVTVLLKETIDGLQVKDNGVYLDGTLGSGGHSEEICNSAKNITIVGIDADKDAIKRSTERLQNKSCQTFFEVSNNYNLDRVLEKLDIKQIDGAVFDLGFSSDQLEDSGRGFSFKNDEPLLMTLKDEIGPDDLTAKEIVNEWGEDSISAILEGYGEERFASRIARKIVEERENKEIKTTFDLVEIIKSAVPKFYLRKKIHPATKTFQALRITVNNEIENLKVTLRKAFEHLKPGGRMSVISFHSIEDRIVKHYFRHLSDQDEGKVITKRPIAPSSSEVRENPRSRSAKLRIIEKK